MTHSVDLILPFVNPKPGWEKNVSAHFRLLQSMNDALRYELILVDDGSGNPENAAEGCEFLMSNGIPARLIQYPKNKGKGHALRVGIEASSAQFAVYTDIDFPYEPKSVNDVVIELTKGADVVLGYRENDYYVSVPLFRTLLSKAFRFVLKGLLRFPITDTQCGLKGMNANGKSVFLATRIDRFLVDMEFIKLAVNKHRLNVSPVVVKLRSNIEFSTMGAGVLLREGVNFLRILVA